MLLELDCRNTKYFSLMPCKRPKYGHLQASFWLRWGLADGAIGAVLLREPPINTALINIGGASAVLFCAVLEELVVFCMLMAAVLAFTG